MAVRNEERHIELVLSSLLQQKTTGWDIEIIVVDGDSTDATGDIVKRVASYDSRVKLITNKHRKTPYAFNLGIEKARGEYICILGAHTRYANNYIATCLDELKLHGVAGCSGRVIVRPGGDSLQARLIAWTLSHPFGTSSGSMRTRASGFADSIPYPLFLKSTVVSVGGYDTALHRNQDNDLNQRLRAQGHKLYITDKTCCEYFVSKDLLSLARYAYKTGYWNIISVKMNPASMSMRHFVPGAFVLALSLSMLVAGYSIMTHAQSWMSLPLILLVALYSLVCVTASWHTAWRERSLEPLLMPLSLFLLHAVYGAGTLSAILGNARSPSSH
ncbi:glycosyltransferase family 2 protein [Edaphobacter sp. HDX4]|uniref:glycosyltransferase family 2 protein n=1 Tax=Edaphobacter sp. HDX4 TaxID=2794064 RepID=UPI002FE6968E